MRTLLALALLTLGGLAWRSTPRADADPLAPDRPIASLVPARCLVFVDAGGLQPVLEQGLAHPFLVALRAAPLGAFVEQALARPPEAWLAEADAWLGCDARALAAELSARGLALGLEPREPGGEPGGARVVLVAHGSDPERVAQGVSALLSALERQLGLEGVLARPARRALGADLWRLGEAWLARREALVVLTNDEELLEETLELADDPLGQGLLAREGFVALAATRPAAATLWGWLALEELEPHADAGFRALRAAERQPAAQGLLGARLASLAGAPELALALRLDGRGLALSLRSRGSVGVASLLPRARAAEVPAEPAGASLASALVYRDYARFVAERAALFEPEVLPHFAEALSNGALFFEGRDLGEEVLPALSPWIRLVVRAPDFEPGREPEIPLPAAAAIAVLADEGAGEAWISAFQSLVAVIGVDRAQKGGAALRLVVAREGEHELSAARFPTPRPGDGIDLRYNLQPALAVVGRQLVLGTHESLVRALVRELAGTAPREATGGHESLTLATPGFLRLLARNRAHLVARKVLEEGLDAAAAARELDGLEALLRTVADLWLALDADGEAAATLELELVLAGPEERR